MSYGQGSSGAASMSHGHSSHGAYFTEGWRDGTLSPPPLPPGWQREPHGFSSSHLNAPRSLTADEIAAIPEALLLQHNPAFQRLDAYNHHLSELVEMFKARKEGAPSHSLQHQQHVRAPAPPPPQQYQQHSDQSPASRLARLLEPVKRDKVWKRSDFPDPDAMLFTREDAKKVKHRFTKTQITVTFQGEQLSKKRHGEVEEGVRLAMGRFDEFKRLLTSVDPRAAAKLDTFSDWFKTQLPFLNIVAIELENAYEELGYCDDNTHYKVYKWLERAFKSKQQGRKQEASSDEEEERPLRRVPPPPGRSKAQQRAAKRKRDDADDNEDLPSLPFAKAARRASSSSRSTLPSSSSASLALSAPTASPRRPAPRATTLTASNRGRASAAQQHHHDKDDFDDVDDDDDVNDLLEKEASRRYGQADDDESTESEEDFSSRKKTKKSEAQKKKEEKGKARAISPAGHTTHTLGKSERDHARSSAAREKLIQPSVNKLREAVKVNAMKLDDDRCKALMAALETLDDAQLYGLDPDKDAAAEFKTWLEGIENVPAAVEADDEDERGVTFGHKALGAWASAVRLPALKSSSTWGSVQNACRVLAALLRMWSIGLRQIKLSAAGSDAEQRPIVGSHIDQVCDCVGIAFSVTTGDETSAASSSSARVLPVPSTSRTPDNPDAEAFPASQTTGAAASGEAGANVNPKKRSSVEKELASGIVSEDCIKVSLQIQSSCIEGRSMF
ncbi:hypothetical protein OC842_004733 [Tilletia horrida]|uniref:Uncharacterized protein n=1 Tax=Tilletia horrida TaxID=155126 RepID=A0AAN6GBN4_9BASI|nr:hypothetical protein OC842_004733 [Tilletia horrida]